MQGIQRWEGALGIAAAVLFVGAVLGFGAALPLFDPIGHPVALLGAMGVPHALAFNIVGFALPGLLASLVALRLLLRVPRTAPWSMRVGAQLLMLAGVGFTAMGGAIGSGGLGDLAFRDGYQRSHTDVALVTVVLLLVLVQILQMIGDRLVSHYSRK